MASAYNHISDRLSNWIKQQVYIRRMATPFGIGALLLVAIGCGYLAAHDLFLIPIVLGIALVGIVIVYYCLFQPLIGYYIASLAAIFYFYGMRLIGKVMPFSTGVELLMLLIFLGTLLWVRPKEERKSNLLKTGISIAIILNFIMIAVEAFNPNVDNIIGWIPSFKRYVVCMLIYVTAYRLIDTPAKYRYFLRFWITMAFIIAIYGVYQQFFGLTQFELFFVNLQPGAYELMFQGGQLRKFSFLSDVATFGLFCGAMGVLCLIKAINEKNQKKKYTLFFFFLVLEMGMGFSGTRTATIMLPAGLALYGIITIQSRRTVIALFVAVLGMMFILFAPIYNNMTINRIRTTFDSKDESLNLRSRNRHFIQPYIYAHPMGGGVATTDLEGEQYYPDHPLAGFPPDSGMLKTALELGWIGVMVNGFFYLMIFYQGINYYFRMRNEEFKLYMVMTLSTIFTTIVTLYSQNSVGQFPMVVFMFSSLSLMKRLKEFDDKWEKTSVTQEVDVLN